MTSRYAFHFSPRRGWMNDPNGLIERDGVHHLFFQHNPDGPVFGRIHWGHASSRDLVTWTEQPVALTPGDDGDYDLDGCWSGCAVALSDGRVCVLYSAHRDGRDLPALAASLDAGLVYWDKSPSNPVIASRPDVPELTDLRDHALIRSDGGWRQVLAAGRDSALAGRRDAGNPPDHGRGGLLVTYLCDGDDLTTWTYDGVLLDGREAGLPGEVWECPDVFATGAMADGEAVVVLSWYVRDGADAELVVNDVVWLTGALVAGRFFPTRYGRLDLGDRFYAPQSYATADGRRIMIGWLRTQLDPASVGQRAVGAASLPRALRVLNGRVHQSPVAEVHDLPRTRLGVLDRDHPVVRLSQPAAALELVVSGTDALASVVLELTGDDGHILTVSLAAFGVPSTWLREGGQWVAEQSTSTWASVLVDGGLVEIFTDDGRASASSDLALAPVQRVRLRTAGLDISVVVSTIDPPSLRV